MGDCSVDITAWIQRMVKESGLSSIQLQFHNIGIATDTKPKESTLGAEKTGDTTHAIPNTITTTQKSVATSEWRDLDTLLFPEDKEG